jgi:Polysaccharide deacetylase
MEFPSYFVVSLDFELLWGVRDKRTIGEYGQNLLGVREAVPALLRLFDRFSIHATWATVGLLFCSGRKEALEFSPADRPQYTRGRFSPYSEADDWGDDEQSDPYRFAPTLIDAIAGAPSQEIATHTFSHFYCLEEGQTVAAFEADLGAASRIAERRGITLRSIVFPRNQVNPEHLAVCRRMGLRSYRGTLAHSFYGPRREEAQGRVLRAKRLLDNYIPLTADRTTTLAQLGTEKPFNVAASSFLRPYSSRLAFMDGQRRRRIGSELTRAARQGGIYHLWWHPHNFGKNLSANLRFLHDLLEHFAALRSRYGMQSVTMDELAGIRDRQLGTAA